MQAVSEAAEQQVRAAGGEALLECSLNRLPLEIADGHVDPAPVLPCARRAQLGHPAEEPDGRRGQGEEQAAPHGSQWAMTALSCWHGASLKHSVIPLLCAAAAWQSNGRA